MNRIATNLKQLISHSAHNKGKAGEKAPFKRTLLVETLEQRVLLAADPLAVARVQGSIDSPGEVDHYTFHLDNAAQISFDSLTENGNLHWSLNGPAGNVVNQAYFAALSGNNGNYAPMNLGPGDYTLDVNSNADTTGAYDLRLLDLARATPITPDTPVSGTIDLHAKTEAFTFDGTAGDQLYLDWTTHPDSYLRIYDPYGQQVTTGYGLYYEGLVPTLNYTGRYTVLLDASNSVNAGTAYAFTLHKVLSPVQELGTWTSNTQAVTGALNGPGDTSVIHFSVNGQRSIVVDSLTNSDNIVFSLTSSGGPVTDSYGQPVTNRGLANYADHGYYGTGLIDLPTGDYTLTVSGNSGTTSPFSLRLLNVAGGTTINKSDVVTGQLSPGNVAQIYRFSATAGDNINFDALSSTSGSNPSIKLLDPYGRRITYGFGFGDLNNLALGYTGTYTLIVSGENGRTAATDYSFKLVDNGNTPPTPLPVGTALALGDAVTGSIAAAGGTQTYNFTLAQGTTLYFDPQSITPNYGVYWSLQGPRGAEVTDAHFGYYNGEEGARLIKVPAGDYALTLRSDAALPNFKFRLLDLAAAQAPITLNQAVTGELNPGNGAAIYTFNATAGQHVFMRTTSASNNALRWRLVDPSGHETVGNTGWNDWEGDLAYAGAYTLLVEGYNAIASPISYEFSVFSQADKQLTYDPAVSTGLAPTWTTDGSHAAVVFDGQHDVQIAANSQLNLTQNLSFQTRVRIDNFDKTWQSIVYKGPNTGDYNSRSYTLWVNSGGYFYLTTSDNQGQMDLSTTAGSVKTGTWYDVTGVIDRGTGLMKIYINGTEAASTAIRTTTGNARVQDTPLYLGDSHEGWGGNNSGLVGAISEFRLWDKALSAAEVTQYLTTAPTPASDTHLKTWLRMDEAAGAALADSSLNGLNGTIRSRFANTTGVAAGTIDMPGQKVVYHLSLPQTKTFYLDSLTSYYAGNNVQLQISGPTVNFNETLAYFYNRELTLAAGDYTITVDPNGRTATAYAFRLIDVATAQNLTLGDVVNGSLSPGDTAQLYKFDVTAGDAVYFESLGSTGFNPAWRLVDPFGREVFGRTGIGTRDTTTLPYTGTYTLIVDGDYSNYDQSSTYSFKLRNVTPTTQQNVDIVAGMDAGVQRTTGLSGGAVQVSDAQYIEFPETPATDQTGSFTLETTFRIDRMPSGSWIPLLTKTNSDALRQIGLFINADGRFHLGTYPDNSSGYSSIESASGLATTGVWHRVAAVYDRVNSQLRIVLDGVQIANGYLNPQAAVDLSEPLRMGFNTEGYDFYGFQVDIDQLAIWNKALTTPEVVASDATTLSGSEANLVALYRFDEASGAALTDVKGGASGAIKRVAALTNGLIVGRLEEPGQTQHYQFTLTSPKQLYLDSFTYRYDLHWTLTGPGTALSNSFAAADSNNSYNLLNLTAGTYDIVIDGDNAAIGDYMFRFVDAANATSISLDQTVNGRLDPGRVTNIYHFDATAGQQVYFDTLSYDVQKPVWRLLDPTGAQVVGITWFDDHDTFALARSGTYTLIVEDYGSANTRNPARGYSFAMRSVSDVNKALTLGTSQFRGQTWTTGPVAGEPAVAFDGSRQLITDPAPSLDLTGSFTLEAMVKVDGFGNTWTPLISRCGIDWNQQTFGLWLGSSGQVNLDSNANGSGWYFGSANNIIKTGQWYRISATLDRTSGIGNIYVDGVEVASSSINKTAALSLPNASLHVGTTDQNNGDRAELQGAVSDVRVWNLARTQADIAASKNATLTGTETGLVYNLKLNEGSGTSVADSGPNHIATRAAGLYNDLGGTVIEGTLSQVGGRVVYTFTPASDRKVLFDSLTPDGRFDWSLIGPDGAVVDNYGQTLNNRRLRDSDAYSRVFFNLKAGQTYQLIVDGEGEATGNYAFRLADFADAQLIGYDTPTTSNTNESRTTALYAFNGTAGDQIVFDRISYTDTRPIWRAFDPSGHEIYSGDFYYDSGTITLTQTGRYTFALEGQIDARGQGSQTFQIQKVGTTTVPGLPSGTAVTFTGGVAPITGTLTAINDPKVYNFTLSAPKRIYVDTLISAYPNYYLNWTLTGPAGTVDSHWAYDTDGLNRRAWYDLPAGDYAFTVQTNNASGVGTFQFQLLDFAAATPMTLGTAVTGALTPANATQVYSFDGQNGDKLFLNASSQSNMGNAYWRVIHADTGAEVAGGYFGNNLDGVLLNRTGSYLLMIEGYYGTTGATASYGFTAYKNQDTTQALTLGATVNTSIDVPGDTKRFTFTLNAPRALWFDSFTNRTDIVWRVLDSDGQSVLGDRYLSDYAGYNQSGLQLKAGQYTLVIDGNNAATGATSFRLLDMANAMAITPGTSVSGQLAPGSEADLYKFSANAGDSFYFDVLTRSGGNTYWRLVDPLGQNVFWNEGLGNHGTTKLSLTGTYTLVIEGYPSDTTAVNYTFNVVPVLDQAPVQLSIGVQPAPNLVVQGLSVTGSDGSIHSGGSINVNWTTANTGDRDATSSFQERVVVKNASGETIANVLVPYAQGTLGNLAVGASAARSAVVQLPSGSRGAGQITVSVITDVTNAVAEQGTAGENDNSAQTQVASTLLTYPDLTVSNIAITPAEGLLAGTQATINWKVNNSGDKATAQAWTDRVVVRNISTGDVLLDQTTRIDAASAAVAAGGFVNRQLAFNWPNGRQSTGDFEVTVTTDVQGEIAEYNAADTGETNNAGTLNFSNAPDLQVSDLQVLNAAPTSGDMLNLQWTVNNSGNTSTPQGWFDRVQVYNQTTGQYIVNVDVFYDPVAATGHALPAGASATRSFSVRLPDGAQSVGNLLISVTADQNASGASLIPERNENNNTGSLVKAVTPRPYPNLQVTQFTSPSTQRSGDNAHFTWTVTNAGNATTNVATWSDRVILSQDNIIGNSDDIAVATKTHNGVLNAGGSYNVELDALVPAGLDGNYHFALVTDAFSNITEPDTRADNTSAVSDVLLTAYHADLQARFTSVPANATGGNTMTVSWHVSNQGDAATSSYWYDQLWLSPDGTLGAGAIQLGAWGHSGALAVGEGYDTTQQVLVPNGLSGTYKLVLRTDAYNYVFESRFEADNTVVSASNVIVTQAPAVDLRVQNVTGPTQVRPGDVQTVQWDVRNTGVGTARQPWTDQVFLSRDGTLSNAVYLGAVTHDAALNGGDAYHASLQFSTPDVADGNWQLVVVTDVANQVYETGAADAESANTGSSAALGVTHADLRPTDIAVTALTGGQAGTLTWTDRNEGSGTAQAGWVDKVYLSADGTLDGSDVLLGQFTVNADLAAGATASRSLSVTPPMDASGSYRIFVVSDANNNVREVGGEGNNTAQITTAITAAPLPNLQVSDITGPATGLAGRQVQLSWTTSNTGNLAASGSWAEQVWLSSDDAIGGDQLLANFYYNGNNLAQAGQAGSSVTRTETVTLPTYAAAGNYKLVVRVDTGSALLERNELDNAAIASSPLAIGAALSLNLSREAVAEQAGANAFTGTIVRSGATDTALVVSLGSSLNDLTLPATVTIAAGQSSVSFAVGVTDNTRVDGNRAGTVTATANGFANTSAAITIQDNDVPTLTFSAPATTIDEGHGPLTITVTRNTADTSAALTVNLTNTKPYKMTSPDSVVIAAGATSATFQVTPVNDTVAEGNRSIDLTGAAAGFVSGGLKIDVLDNDIPVLNLDLSSSVVSEGAGVAAVHGTLTRSIVTDTAVTVAVFADVTRVRTPTYVIIGAGEASADFDISIQDNNQADGDHQVVISADVADAFSFVSLLGTRVQKSLLVTDDDGPTLTVKLTPTVIAESAGVGAAIGTVTRNTPATSDLVVQLSSTDTTEATVPATVVIPAGQQSATFTINAVQDGVQDGTQNATIVASAGSFNSGSATIQVTDRDLADLQVSTIVVPVSAKTGTTAGIDWTVTNSGLGAASSQWADAVYLSSDNVLSGDDDLIGSFANTVPLGQGMSYTKHTDVQLGNRVGQVYVFVVTDNGDNVTELSSGNNTKATILNVTPAYRATVSTDVTQTSGGAVVPLSGHVFDPDTNAAKPYALVTIDVSTGGTVRTIDAFADAHGNFTAEFTPLPGEAGHYTISADHPGVIDRTAQDSFDVIGMKANNGVTLNLLPGQTQTGQIEIKNLSPVALSNLHASLANVPPGLTFTFDDVATLAGDGTALLGYKVIVAADATALYGSAPITITCDQGVTITTPLNLSVTPLTPKLVSNPGYVASGMLRGKQTTVSFDVTNTGGAATGTLQVQLPEGLSWLSLASQQQLASLAPGETTKVTLMLTPGQDLPLQRYDGTINVVSGNSYVTVPFQFRAVSEATGDVQVTVQDEYTYFGETKPNLAGATVQLLDPYNYTVVATAVTDATGIITFANVAEGPYTLQVSAPSHDTTRATVQVTPGSTSSQEIFLHRQAVTYNWTVVPTEVQDHYKIVLESTFETEVPMPVVTVDEPFIMPIIVPGYESQFNITLRNHGLVNATQVKIQVPEDPDYIITPLISELPVLAAKSEVTIPCKISIRPDSPLLAAALAASSTGEVTSTGAIGDTAKVLKCLGIDTLYTYECKNNQWVAVPTKITPVLDAAKCLEKAYENLPKLLKSSNLLNAGCDALGIVLSCIKLDTCVKALITTACKAATGAAKGGWVGAGAGVLDNWKDILSCLCELAKKLDFGSGSTTGGGGPGWSWGGGYGGPGAPYGTPIGYTIPYSGCSDTASTGTDTNLTQQGSNNGVCAEVRLRIEQQAVITRTGFLGTLEINNGRSDTTLQDVKMTLDIRDDQGKSANDKFLVRGPTLQDVEIGPDGKWTIKPSSTGKVQYTFIPTLDAAPDAPVIYSMGGVLHYIDNGTVVDVPLLPARITVYPEARLNLDYFWQRDVYGDDPFTEQVEPSLPFALGLQVTNVGKGGAGDLTITSAQPQIIENEKGLLVDFKIIGSQVGANPGTSSLTVDLGNIAPGATQTAQWNLISSLQGKFKDFSASFEHLDDNGDMRTSLIQKVNIHELTRAVQVTSPTDDHIPDYLVNDVPDPDNTPDVLYLSTGGQAAVTLATSASLSGGGLTRTLTAQMQAGWSYVTVPDALPGYELTSVVRSDGKVIPLEGMVWRTNRTFKAGEPGATNENLIHLLDLNSTGSYTFTFAIVDHVAPTIDQLTGVVGGVHTDPVDALDVTFSEDIDQATLTANDVRLTLNGADVAVPDLTVSYVSGHTWRIEGLGSATTADGNYRLTIKGQGITDLAGNAATNSATLDWAMGASAPVILDVQAIVPALRNTPVASADVSFSRDMDASSLEWTDLILTRDGTAIDLNSGVSVNQIDGKTFRINGLDSLTAQQGNYELTVRASGTKDSNGVAGIGQFSRSWRTDVTAPVVTSIEHLSTNPRNIVVQALDVTFSEAIDPRSFDWRDITLTRNGEADNLITNEVTVEQVNDTTWRIKGFNWKVGLDGQYVLSVNGSGIVDLAGNAGTGTVSEAWTMDIVDPLAPTNLVLSPDTGVSGTDLLTNKLNLQLTGDLPEAGLQVRLTDVTNNKELGYATVTNVGGVNHFTSSFTLSSPGQHKIRVRVADAAANLSPDTFIEVFVDNTAPGVASIANVSPSPRTTPVSSIDVTLDEAIDASTFNYQDLSLTRDGVAVALDSSVTVALVSGNTYRISGLDAFTTAAGAYQFSVSATGLVDRAGNAGKGDSSATWTTQAVLPTGIRGKVYEDIDGSGTYNPASYNPEAGIAGRTVYLDANNNGALDAGEVFTATAADGSYAFDNLADGAYRVSQVLPANWVGTAPVGNAYNVSVTQGHTISGADFGAFLTGTISGTKFNDLNADGTREAGEAALAGWTVFLDANANGVLDAGEASTTTDANGLFTFSGVNPGTVQVGEVVPATPNVTWQRTTPAVPYHIKSGFSISADLGSVQLGTISGAKINDLNGNGVRDANEPGIAGWTIFLDTNGNGILDAGETSTLTDANGHYTFSNLLPGQYVIAEEQRAGWVQTTPLPAPAGVGITTAGSDIQLEADCACGGTWATATGPAMIDYGQVAIQSALDTVGITKLRADGTYGNLDGHGTTTVVIDTGIDLNHSFFGADLDGNGIDDRIVYQHDFANNDDDASDVNGHGSHVSSIIGSQNGLYPGVATGTDLIELKVFEDSGKGYFSYLEKALQWVVNNREQYHIGVVNLSLGDNGNWTDDFSRYGLGDELAALAQTDVIVIAAAGNNYLQFGKMGVAYPASDPAAIAVGATWAADFGGPWTVSTGATNYATGADQIAAFSQRDTSLMDTFAPGARFNGANANGGITTMQGTSQAAAFVSGAAALAQQVAQQTLGRRLTTGEFANLLHTTGDLITDGDDEVDNVVNTGLKYPRLNMEKLLAGIAQLKEPTTGTPGGSTSGSGQTTAPQQAAAGVHTVTLNAGAQLSDKDFGNFKLGTVSGQVFTDTDGNGARNGTEGGQQAVTVYLDANSNGSLDADERNVITDATGHFSFGDIGPGTAIVRIVTPAGQTLSTAVSHSLVATSGLTQTGVDFGLKALVLAPVAHDDTATTAEDTPVTIDVLANDEANGASALAVQTQAAHGDVAVVNGKLVYTPKPNYNGTDSFSYTLGDGQGHSSTATVSLTVTPVNDAPVLAAIAAQTVREGDTLTLTLHAIDPDDTALSYQLLQGPQGASVNASTGVLTWTATDVDTPQLFNVAVRDPSGSTSTQQFSVQVQLGQLVVTAFESKAWGFAVRFNDIIDPSKLNVYGSATPDVSVVGSTTGAVKGSVVYDDDGKGFSFVRTGAQLATDSYSVLIRGATDGAANTRRGALDGDTNGTAGGNYLRGFSIGTAPAVRLRLPDFARGPGQAVNVPTSGTGLPITLSSNGTVTSLQLRLRADVDTFSITELRRGADLPADATLTVTPVSGQPGQFDITITRATPLPVGSLKLIAVIGNVPNTARLGDSGAVVLDAVFVNGVAAPLAGDAAVDIVAYPGDVNFDGQYTDADVKQMGRLVANLDNGLPQIDDVDASIVADIDGNGVLNALDTAQVLARTKATSTAAIPAVPVLPPAPAITAASLSMATLLSSTSTLPSATTAAAPSPSATAAASPAVNLAGSYGNFSLSSSTASPASVSTLAVVPSSDVRILASVTSTGAAAAA